MIEICQIQSPNQHAYNLKLIHEQFKGNCPQWVSEGVLSENPIAVHDKEMKSYFPPLCKY